HLEQRSRRDLVRIMKDASEAGSTTGDAWGHQLTDSQTLTAGFLDSLQSVSFYDALRLDTIMLPSRTRIVGILQDMTARRVAEGAPMPVARLTLDGDVLD